MGSSFSQGTPYSTLADDFRILMIGGGTVGQALYRAIDERQDFLAERTGRSWRFVRVVVRDATRARGIPGDLLTADLDSAISQPHDVLVEVAGGVEGPREWIRESLACGIPVVTANKALLALHGDEIFGGATPIRWEAAVAGGIPVIDTMERILSGNRITRIEGVLNGTTNFILNEMESGQTYAEALIEAQRLGYAEADPTSDVDGFDPLYKVSLLASLAVGYPVRPVAARQDGIRDFPVSRIQAAMAEGRRVRLVATADIDSESVTLAVDPREFDASHPFSQLSGPQNAIQVTGDLCGTVTLIGQGAGGDATASSVLGDLMILAQS